MVNGVRFVTVFATNAVFWAVNATFY